jgi:uncharacterized membrane protein
VTLALLKLIHIIGLVLIGAGLVGVFFADLRSRQSRELPLFAEAVRNIAVFYDGLVVPGALLLLGSGTWLIVEVYGGWDFVRLPWLAGMVALFAFEFIEGNTVTRLYFMRLRRLTRAALAQGRFTPEVEAARARNRADVHALSRPADPAGDRRARRHAPGDVGLVRRRLVHRHCRRHGIDLVAAATLSVGAGKIAP